MWTGMRSTKARAKNAPGSAIAPIRKRKGDDLRGDDAGQSEHGNLDDAGRDRDQSVGRGSRPRLRDPRHQQRQQNHAPSRSAATRCRTHRAKAKPGVTDANVAASRHGDAAARSKSAWCRSPAPRRHWSAWYNRRRRAPSSTRGRDHDQRAATVDIAAIAMTRLRLEKTPDIAMIGPPARRRSEAQNQWHQRAGARSRPGLRPRRQIARRMPPILVGQRNVAKPESRFTACRRG